MSITNDQLWDVAMSIRPDARMIEEPDGSQRLVYPQAVGVIRVDGHRFTVEFEWVWDFSPIGQQSMRFPCSSFGPCVMHEKQPFPIDVVRTMSQHKR